MPTVAPGDASLSAQRHPTEDRARFAAVRALRFDRGRSARTVRDAKLEIRRRRDSLVVTGLCRMAHCALER